MGERAQDPRVLATIARELEMTPKVHWERPWPPNVLFTTLPALCGRKRPTDYRMLPPDDQIRRRASRKFYADRPRDVTCKTCMALLQRASKE